MRSVKSQITSNRVYAEDYTDCFDGRMSVEGAEEDAK